MSYSPTRLKFYAAKKAARENRERIKYRNEHTFWCMGTRRRRGDEHALCMHEVFFKEEREGALASCRFCKQAHAFNKPLGKKGRWMTVEEYESTAPAAREAEEQMLMPGVEADPEHKGMHLQSCKNKSIVLYGMKSTVCSDGRVMWTMPGERGFKHICWPKGRMKQVLSQGPQSPKLNFKRLSPKRILDKWRAEKHIQ